MAVLDLRGDPSFPREALRDRRSPRELRLQGLERDASPEREMNGLVHGSHAAFAKEANDAELPRDHLVGRERGHPRTIPEMRLSNPRSVADQAVIAT